MLIAYAFRFILNRKRANGLGMILAYARSIP